MNAETTVAPVFDPKTARQIHDWEHNARLLCCRVDPMGRFVVAGGIDYTIQRWEIATGTKTALTGHDNWIRTLGFSPDGATLYSGGYDGQLISWETGAAAPQPVRRIQAHQGWLRGLAVSGDGQLLATCGNDRLVKVWNATDGQLIRELPGHSSIPYCLHFVPGSQELVSGDITGNIHHWRSDAGQLVRKFDASEIHNLIGDLAPFGGIINLAFSPDLKRLTATGLHKTSNAPAGARRAVALSFNWDSGEKLPKQESIKKELDATMWRALYHPTGIMLGVVQKEIGFWNPGEEDVFHLLETPSDIFDFDLHPNQADLYTAHFDGHVRCHQMVAKPMLSQ
ncbi:MAG: WD40 repeat domain-containing protein [Planctomycetes bacterium]|nr:WD40 repeat domain-containing protein [Planctomycetota bacterium]